MHHVEVHAHAPVHAMFMRDPWKIEGYDLDFVHHLFGLWCPVASTPAVSYRPTCLPTYLESSWLRTDHHE